MPSLTERIDITQTAALIQDGDTLALGGMALYRSPVAFVRALLRHSRHDVTLLAFTAGYAADLLVGAGVVSAVRSVYFGLEAFGLAPMFTHRANHGEITVIEETETSIVLGLRATVGGVDYLPSRAWQGTDLLALRPDVKTISDPYTGKVLTAFPAIAVDVAVIHALAVDAEGNAAINNNLAIDQLLVYAADMVIVTTEQFVDAVQPTPQTTIIPAPGVDYVALAPRGAHPTSCYPLYTIAGRDLMHYTESATTEDGFRAYLADWLRDT